jgi:prepilin-type N-terminal cleavage/methylation domain-containing protein
MEGQSIRAPAPRGYTLLEMLVVLAVLALLCSLSWPAVHGMFGKGELREAAKQVRVALVKARLGAIESGVAQRFRYLPGTERFEVAPLPTSLDEEKTAAPWRFRPRASADEPIQGFLPKGVIFEEYDPRHDPGNDSRVAAPVSALPRAGAQPQVSPLPQSGEGPGVRGRDDANWSAPIVFFPNGRSVNARIRLAGPRGLWIEVTLRGTNGATRIGPLERREEGP